MKKKSIAIVIAVLLIALLMTGCGGGNGGGGSGSSGNISLEQLNSIENGMSYDEVVEIFGRDGTFFHEGGNARVYHWENTSPNALITVIFVDGEVYATGESGLS